MSRRWQSASLREFKGGIIPSVHSDGIHSGSGVVPVHTARLREAFAALALLPFVSCSSPPSPAELACGLVVADPFTNVSDSVIDLPLTQVTSLVASDSLPLGFVRGAVFAGEGIAVANGGPKEPEIRIVTLDGTSYGRQGGRGFGEDQYMNLNGIARYQDGVVSWDEYHGRLTHMDARGAVLGNVALHDTVQDGTFAYHNATLVGIFGDLALLEFRPSGGYRGQSFDPVRVRDDVTHLLVGMEDGAVLRSTILPGEELWAAHRDGVFGGIPIPFGRNVTSAVTPDGIWFVDTDAARLQRYSPEGNLCSVEFDHSPVSVETNWLDSVHATVHAAIATMSSPRVRAFRQGLMEAGLPAQSTVPVRVRDQRWKGRDVMAEPVSHPRRSGRNVGGTRPQLWCEGTVEHSVGGNGHGLRHRSCPDPRGRHEWKQQAGRI